MIVQILRLERTVGGLIRRSERCHVGPVHAATARNPYQWPMVRARQPFYPESMHRKAVIELNAFRDFRAGLARLRDGEPEAATELLRHAFDCDPENPYYVSYYGLSLAHAKAKWVEAEQFCHTAVCRGRRQAQLYLNLAEVYLKSNRRQAAADTLARGLHYLPQDARLQTAFSQLAMRRPLVLGFLVRANILNRTLGQLRHRLLQLLPRRKWMTPRESRA